MGPPGGGQALAELPGAEDRLRCAMPRWDLHAVDRNTRRLVAQAKREAKIEKRRQKSLEHKAARAAETKADRATKGTTSV